MPDFYQNPGYRANVLLVLIDNSFVCELKLGVEWYIYGHVLEQSRPVQLVMTTVHLDMLRQRNFLHNSGTLEVRSA